MTKLLWSAPIAMFIVVGFFIAGWLTPNSERALASKVDPPCGQVTKKIAKKLRNLEKKAVAAAGQEDDTMTGVAYGACGTSGIIQEIAVDITTEDFGVAFQNIGTCPIVVTIDLNGTSETIPLDPNEKAVDFFDDVLRISFQCQNAGDFSACCALAFSIVEED